MERPSLSIPEQPAAPSPLVSALSSALSPAQWQTLQALIDCIIPADDFPSGWQAGVGDYLAGQFARDLVALVPSYQQGLDALEAEALAQYGAGFGALAPTTQSNLLIAIDAGAVRAAWPIDPVAFFRMVVEHTHEGYYSDPSNGGNRNGIGWDMVGYAVKG